MDFGKQVLENVSFDMRLAKTHEIYCFESLILQHVLGGEERYPLGIQISVLSASMHFTFVGTYLYQHKVTHMLLTLTEHPDFYIECIINTSYTTAAYSLTQMLAKKKLSIQTIDDT